MRRFRGAFLGIGMAIALLAGACSVVSGLDQYSSSSSSNHCTGAGCQNGSGPDAGDSMGNVSEDSTVEAGGDDMSADMMAPGDGESSDDGAVGGDASDGAGDTGSNEGGNGDSGGGVVDAGDAGSCACIDSAPSGWTGYVQLVLSDAGAPACPAPYAMTTRTTKTNPTGAPAQCTACSCMPPSGFPITCQVQLGSGGAACFNEAMTPAPQNVCVTPPGPVGITSGPNGDSYGPTMVPAPIGTCAPSGGQVAQTPAAPGSTSVSVCVVAGGGIAGECASSTQACWPTPQGAAGSPSGRCIYQSGVQVCPSGIYSARFVTSDSFTDTRGCGACACAAPSCPTDGYVAGYTSIDCSGNPAATFSATTSCALGNNANGSKTFKYFPSHSAWTGTCAVSSSGGPTGKVTIDMGSATTFCCVP